MIALAVFCINCVLIMKIDIGLYIRCVLCLTIQCHCLFDDFRKTLAFDCSRVDDRAAKHFFQSRDINCGLFFLVDIRFVQSHDNRDSKLQQLRCEKQAAAEVCCIHNVDNCIRMLITDILTGDTFLRCKRGHGISTGKVDCNCLDTLCVLILNRVFLTADCDAAPVAYLFTSARQIIIHCCLAAVRVAGKSNSHTEPPL